MLLIYLFCFVQLIDKLYSNSQTFGDSSIDISTLLYQFFDEYITQKLEQNANVIVSINGNNRQKFYQITSIKLYSRCNMTRKFRKMSIDTYNGVYYTIFQYLTSHY